MAERATKRSIGWWGRGRAGVVAVGVLLALGLTACHEISVDYTTRQVTHEASVEVTPTTMEVGGQQVPAIDIALRYCDVIQVTGLPSPDGPGTLPFPDARPTAWIVDGTGATVFQSFQMYQAYPGGAVAVDAGDPDVTDHLLVPVAGFQPPLTINAGCTTYQGWGSLPNLSFTFDPCTTSNRTCGTIRTGRIVQSPSNWLWDDSTS